MSITASKLYDYTQCKHKVWRDKNGPQNEKNPEDNPFVKLLWVRGVSHEKEVIKSIGEYLDLGDGDLTDRFNKTMEAIKRGEPLIYQGVLLSGDDRGIPDLLRKRPDGKYMPVDIKSGAAYEGQDEDESEEGKPKLHYAVQLCFYVDLLDQLGIENTKKGAIIDITTSEFVYDFDTKRGPRSTLTMRGEYNEIKSDVEELISDRKRNKPASSSKCKMCPWYQSCKDWCKNNDDLTNIFYVGANRRDVINEDLGIEKCSEVASLDLDEIMARKKKNKEFLPGVGKSTLDKIVARSAVLASGEPAIYENITFPAVSYELYFDIEADPTQDFVYMHGIYERGPKGERYIDFTAKEVTDAEESRIWSEFWVYIDSLPKDDFAVYYYSPYERTSYKHLQKKYPEIASPGKVDDFFANPNVIDLYSDVIFKKTDWPLSSYSIKEIAVFLGFSWEDNTPSGALSIEWFNKYISTGNQADLDRILIYNKDDCKATMVIKDYLSK